MFCFSKKNKYHFHHKFLNNINVFQRRINTVLFCFLPQVVGIIKRNWRPYCGVLSKSAKPQVKTWTPKYLLTLS